MPRHVAVVVVHGIMAENISYAEEMRGKLLGRLRKDLRDYVTFRPVFWADSVRGHQRDYLDRARNISGMSIDDIRRFFVHGLGDAAAYQKTRSRKNAAYYDIQDCISWQLQQLDTPQNGNRPLIFIGHSLGCHIVSSYAWDLNWLKHRTDEQLATEPDAELRQQIEQLRNASPFKRLDTFAGFVTMGNNMPLFTFTFGPERVFPITSPRPFERHPGMSPAFPGASLPPGIAARARWLNFYSKSDYLGFPMKPLNEDYRNEKRLEDILVRTESAMSVFSPVTKFISAHTRYWTNPTVLTRTAELIQSIVEAPDEAPPQEAATAGIPSPAR